MLNGFKYSYLLFIICLHKVEWFQVFLYNNHTLTSVIYLHSFWVISSLNTSELFFLYTSITIVFTILFNVNHLFGDSEVVTVIDI